YLGSAAVATAVLLSAARSNAASPEAPTASPPRAAPAAGAPGAPGAAAFGGPGAPGAEAFAGPAAARTGTAAPNPGVPAARVAPVGRPAELLRRMAAGGLTAALAVEFAASPGLTGGAGGDPPAGQQSAPFPAAVRVAGPRDLAAGTIRLRGTIPAVADALP